MRDPPHRCPVPETEGSWMLTSQGQAPASALLPPTTRVRPRSSSEVKGRRPQFPLQEESNFRPAPWLAAAPAEAPHKVWGQHATEWVPVHKELRPPRGVRGAAAWPRRTSGPSPGSPQVLPKLLPEPGATYSQVFHMPCAGWHVASSARRHSSSMAARDSCQLQEQSFCVPATGAKLPCASTAAVLTAPGRSQPWADVTEQPFHVPGPAASGTAATWSRRTVGSEWT